MAMYQGKTNKGVTMKKQINKVSKKECLDALDYFWQVVDLSEDSDRIHYTKILLKKVANDNNIKIEGI